MYLNQKQFPAGIQRTIIATRSITTPIPFHWCHSTCLSPPTPPAFHPEPDPHSSGAPHKNVTFRLEHLIKTDTSRRPGRCGKRGSPIGNCGLSPSEGRLPVPRTTTDSQRRRRSRRKRRRRGDAADAGRQTKGSGGRARGA